MDLTRILGRYESLVMRESVRTRHRKWLRDSGVPLSGVYWWVPGRAGEGLVWVPQVYYDAHYPGGNAHPERWPEVVEFLALKWRRDPAVLRRFLRGRHAALPRGRVREAPGDGAAAWAILHGGDGHGLGGVLHAFNLGLPHAQGRVEAIIEEGERSLPADAHRLRVALGLPDHLAP